MASRLNLLSCCRCRASLRSHSRPRRARLTPPCLLSSHSSSTPTSAIILPVHSRCSFATSAPSSPSVHKPAYGRPSSSPAAESPQSASAPDQPVSLSPDDPLWLLPLAQLRTLLHQPLPFSSVLLILSRLRLSFQAQLIPSDYYLLIHQLALHSTPSQLHSTCQLIFSLFDTYSQQPSFPPPPPATLRDVLSVASRIGEGDICQALLTQLSSLTSATTHDHNLVLWGQRNNESATWRLFHLMEQQHLVDADTLLCLIHANAREDRWVKLDCWMRRAEEMGYLVDKLLPSHLPSLSHLLEHWFLSLDHLWSEFRSWSLSSAFECVEVKGKEWMDGTEGEEVKERLASRHLGIRYLALYQQASRLGCTLSSMSLRLLMRWVNVKDERRGQVTSLELMKHGVKHQLAVARAEEGIEEVKDELDVGHWQLVLDAYDRMVASGQPVGLNESLRAIVACYRGRHWQRAVELLVIPKFPFKEGETQLELEGEKKQKERRVRQENVNRTTNGSSHDRVVDGVEGGPEMQSPEPSTVVRGGVDEAAIGRREDYIELSPVTGQWTGPSDHRVDFTHLLRLQSWIEADQDPALRLRLPSQRPFNSIVSPLPSTRAPPLITSPLHFAYCIAAMDEAGNAESLRKADQLHAIALHHFPFLLHLYDPSLRVVHLVHPVLEEEWSGVSGFVRDEGRTFMRLWGLLYLVWRLMRKRAMGERSECDEVWTLEEWYGSEIKKMRLRVESEEELPVLSRVLMGAPFSLKWGDIERGESEETWQAVLPYHRAAEGVYGPAWNEQRIARGQPVLQWRKGWDQMFPDVQEDDRAPVKSILGYHWLTALQRDD